MNKILAGLIALTSVIALSSCGDDSSYTPAEPETGTKVFFSNTLPKKIEASSAESSVTIKISRTSTSDAATVPLTVSNPDGLFVVPTSASFAAGQADADLVITYDAEKVGFDKYSTITLAVDNSASSLYGIAEYTFQIGIPAPWESLGKCTYFDMYVTDFYIGEDPLPYQVEIQKNLINEGLYRLVYPYGAIYPYNDPGDYDESKTYYLEIHAEDPNKVYIPIQNQGIAWSTYGEFTMGSLAAYYLNKGDEASAEQYYGTFKDGIITFPAGSLLFSMKNYNDGGLYACGQGGIFLAMPGVQLDFSDYTLSLNDMGAFESKSFLAEVINLSMGADVASVMYATFPGKLTEEEVAEIAPQIASGDLESTVTKESGYKLIDVPAEGDYTLIALGYDASNDLVVTEILSFTYTLPSPAETWTPIAIGDYTYNALYPIFGEDPATDEGLILYQGDTNPQSYKIGDWGFEAQDFTFTWDGTAEGVSVGVDILADSYNGIMCGETLEILGTDKYGVSSYDEANSTFNFAVSYYIGTKVYNADIEPFVITGSAPTDAAQMVATYNKANTSAKIAARKHSQETPSVKANMKATGKLIIK